MMSEDECPACEGEGVLFFDVPMFGSYDAAPLTRSEVCYFCGGYKTVELVHDDACDGCGGLGYVERGCGNEIITCEACK